LGHIVFAIFVNPASLPSLTRSSNPLPYSRESADHQFRWRVRGLPPVKGMAESLGVFAEEAKSGLRTPQAKGVLRGWVAETAFPAL
jgi:hypothetical protein